MSDAADRLIADLEQRVKELGWENANLRKAREVQWRTDAELRDRDLAHIASLRKQLVERDVYEAQQILPPEQAALIKHLATVERCIEHGRLEGYDLEDHWCVFCEEYMDDHTKDCAWLALQFDRKPAETMAMVEGWAWEENDRRDRERARAMTPRPPATQRQAGRTMNFGLPYPEPLSADEMRGHFNVTTSPFVPPGKVYVLEGLSSFVTAEETLRVLNERAAPDAPVLEDNANPATVAVDEAPQHPGLEGEPRRPRGREVDEEGVPPVDHRPPDGER